MYTFVCVHTSRFVMAFHRHIRTRLKAYASPEKTASQTTATLDADETQSWGENLVVMAFNVSGEVTCNTASAVGHRSSRKSVSKKPDFEKPVRKNQAALIHFCGDIAQKRSWIDVNLSDYNKDLASRPEQILKGACLITKAIHFLNVKREKLH